MSDLKNSIQHVLGELKGLETRARKLKNQNLADIVTSARARVEQLSGHPDLDLVDEKKDQTAHPDGTPVAFDPKAPTTREEAIDRMRAEHNADPETAARASWPHLFDGTAPDDRKTFHPGEPQFEQQNPNFRNPADVDLNKDGTLQRAPNSLGTAHDVRS